MRNPEHCILIGPTITPRARDTSILRESTVEAPDWCGNASTLKTRGIASSSTRRPRSGSSAGIASTIGTPLPAPTREFQSGVHVRPHLSYPVTTDEALVRSIQTGKAEAALQLYDHLRAGIEATLYRVLRDRPSEFEDLMQITYERVIRTIADGNFQGRSQLKTWASAIAANIAVDYLRRRGVEQRLFENMAITQAVPHAESTVGERQLEARSEVRRVQGVLKRMKPRRANILVLHDILGHSVPQVAELMGINTGAARSTLRRARQEFLRRFAATAGPRDQTL